MTSYKRDQVLFPKTNNPYLKKYIQEGDNPSQYIPKVKRNKLTTYNTRTSIYNQSKTPNKMETNDGLGDIKHSKFRLSNNQLKENLQRRLDELSSIKKFQNTPKISLGENRSSQRKLKSRH